MAVIKYALSLADKSPRVPTNFRVGAVLVRLDDNRIISDGYTLELPGNTHAEQCCLMKLAEKLSVPEEQLGDVMTSPHALYSTVEPCVKRVSGNKPCVERVLRQSSWIKTVYVGVQEPEVFFGENESRRMMEEAGIEVVHVQGFEKEIVAVATAGHASGTS